ncbi:MAG: sulfate adenylyltransferase subunit 2 [Opitutae bacterium]|nr:sulfate adenylyltransferase subunit 2 [Opitutae bacterium]
MKNYNLTHLDQLEAEAIFVLRETAAQFEHPGLLFSGGKDSIVMAHLAYKAFYPSKSPFPLVHVDTGHNFPETIEFRDRFVEKLGAKLIVGLVQDSIDRGTAVEETGPNASRNALQSVTLLETIEKESLDAALGGGRRDEEKARAKERFFSHRDAFGQWDPKNQRHFRVFPLSNWTEMDVWQYLKKEEIELPSLYFAHKREIIERNGSLLAVSDFVSPTEKESPRTDTVRFRTIGDATCTGAVLSTASNLDEVIAEVAASRVTERGTRADDRRSESAMEDRKKQGYF